MPDPDLLEVTRLVSGPDLVSVRPSRADRVAAWWAPRRVLAFVVLGAAVGAWLFDRAAAHPAWFLAATAAVIALSLTSYVPLRGQSMDSVLGSSCSTVGGILPMACAASLLVRGPEGAPFLAAALMIFGLYQRFGNTACGVR